jgi:competence protein ComFA
MAQRDASANLRQFILQPEQREKLVWAACGAGKTEVTFQAIAEVLSRGGKVLFAVPRKGPVQEIGPRLSQAFPQFPPVVLHGTSPDKYRDSQLFVATTHQTIRFYSAFDLIIIDEEDAYPYKDSTMLKTAVERTRKKSGKIIYLTATPSKDLYQRWKRNRLPCIQIPARYHGYPLPEPKLILSKAMGHSNGGITIPDTVVELIHETIEGDLSQLLIFVPSVMLGMQVAEELNKITQLPPFNNFEGTWVKFSHSRDEDREAKRDTFLRGDFPILVTTTIWERGVTVEKVNVLVLFAHVENIFDEPSLIQMAGRSGRSPTYPVGKVWFVGNKITRNMKQARAKIRELNNEAREKGYLKPESSLWLDRWEEKINARGMGKGFG